MAKLSVDQALLRAQSLAKKGQIGDARKLCQDVIDAYPNNKRARATLAKLGTPGPSAADQTPPRDTIERLGALLAEGKPQLAATEAELLAKSFPTAFIVWSLLGAACAEAGDTGRAESAFRQAVTLNPRNPEAHRNLGKILISLGQFDEAAKSCKRALHLKPDYTEAYNTLGNALKAARKHDEAAAAYLHALKIRPNYIEVLYNLGNTLLEMGRSDRAVQIYEKALTLQPDFNAARLGLGLALRQQGRTGDAVTVYQAAVDHRPEDAAAQLQLGNALREDGRTAAALTALRKALEITPGDAEAHNDLGLALQAHGQLDEAEAAFAKALEIRPDYLPAWKNRAVVLVSRGAVPEAVAAYQAALKSRPDDAETHRHLSRIKTFGSDDPQVAAMTEVLKTDLPDADRCQISFALAKAAEDQGDFEQAFAHLKAGNAIRKTLLGYDPAGDETQFAALKATAGSLRDSALPPVAGKPPVTPLFILGMPRSGTTLVEQIVSAHTDVTGAGELGLVERNGAALATGDVPATPENLQAFRDAYLTGLANRSEGRAVVTDKMPLNFRYIALIRATLPEAKIVHATRDPAATCWSNYRQYFENRSLGYCCDLDDTVAYYRLYNDLMQDWSAIYGAHLCHLDYDALTREQEPLTRALITDLGLDWQDACLSPQDNTRAVATASQQQIRRAVYEGSSEAWRRYEPFLGGVFDGFA